MCVNISSLCRDSKNSKNIGFTGICVSMYLCICVFVFLYFHTRPGAALKHLLHVAPKLPWPHVISSPSHNESCLIESKGCCGQTYLDHCVFYDVNAKDGKDREDSSCDPTWLRAPGGTVWTVWALRALLLGPGHIVRLTYFAACALSFRPISCLCYCGWAN